MASPAAQTEDPELEQTGWELDSLVDGEGTDGVEQRLEQALERARAFAAEHAGKLERLDSAALVTAMRELAAIQELVGRAGYFAALRFSTDTADPANGALLQRVQEQETAIQTTLLFFELEWAALGDERAEQLLAGDGLDFCRASPAQRAPLPRAPALRARGEDPRREVADRSQRMDAPVRGAHFRDQGRAARSGELAQRRWRSARGRRAGRGCAAAGGRRPGSRPEPSRAARSRASPQHRRGRHRGSCTGAAHARVPVQHAARRQGH